MREHRKLRAFELADEVVLLIYRETKDFPREEIYGLTSQSLQPNSLQPNSLQSKQPAHSGRLFQIIKV